MTKRRLRNSFVPLFVRANFGAEAADFCSEGPKVGQNLEIHLLVMRPIKLVSGMCWTRRCMCVSGGGRRDPPPAFFSRVKSGEKLGQSRPAEFRHRLFVIWVDGD